MITKKEKPVKKSTCYFAQKPHVKFLIYASAPKNPHLSKASSRTQKRKIKLQSSRKLCFVMPSYFCNSRGQSPWLNFQLSDTNVELAFRLSDIQIPETISFAARSDFHMRPTSLEKQHVSRECRSQGIPIQSCPQRL